MTNRIYLIHCAEVATLMMAFPLELKRPRVEKTIAKYNALKNNWIELSHKSPKSRQSFGSCVWAFALFFQFYLAWVKCSVPFNRPFQTIKINYATHIHTHTLLHMALIFQPRPASALKKKIGTSATSARHIGCTTIYYWKCWIDSPKQTHDHQD